MKIPNPKIGMFKEVLNGRARIAQESLFFGFTAALAGRISALASRPFDRPVVFWVVAGPGERPPTKIQELMTKTMKRLAATAVLLAVSILITSCIIITREGQITESETTLAPMSAALGTNGPAIIVGGTIILGGGSKPNCPGVFTAAVTFKEATGSAWFTPPAGSTSATITDVSGLPSPYLSNVESVESFTTRKACATTSVTFTVSPNRRYQFTTYVTSSPPPGANTTLQLQIQWYR